MHLSAEVVENCSCGLWGALQFPSSLRLYPLVVVSAQRCSWPSFHYSFPFTVGLSGSRLCDFTGSAPAQLPPSSLLWLSFGLSSPRDLRLPSLSLVLLFPSPVGGQIYRLYLWVCMYICKGIYANLNISVRNTLFTLSRLLPCLRAHPSSAQCHHV